MFSRNDTDDGSGHKFHGMYRGEVVDNRDPKRAGRCRIRVFSVFDNVPSAALPWAAYADPMMGGAIEVGGFFVPDIGNHVWCFFEHGNFMLPVYFAGAVAIPHQITERQSANHWENRGSPVYPKNRVFKTKAGHVIEVDDTPGNSKVRVHHKSGTEIIMFENGDMYEHVIGNVKRVVEGSVEEFVTGDFTRVVGGDLTDTITGDAIESVTGDKTESVIGNRTESVIGTATEEYTTKIVEAISLTLTAPIVDIIGTEAINIIGGDITSSGGNVFTTGTTVEAEGVNIPEY